MSYDSKFGSSVKAARLTQNYSQEELAAKAGCSQSAISRLENGNLDAVSDEIAHTICSELGIDPKSYQPNEIYLACTNPTCPLNFLYLLNGGQIGCKPWMTRGSPDKDMYCPACGSLLANRCQDIKCGAPLVSGNAHCSKCGKAYAELPRELKRISNPKRYIEEHNATRKQYLEI
jgi:DNA-binding XRE family transcriptional regulator/transcription elongation factor Elf1